MIQNAINRILESLTDSEKDVFRQILADHAETRPYVEAQEHTEAA